MRFYLTIIILLYCCSCNTGEKPSIKKNTLFEKIDASYSGIQFSNDLKFTEEFNVYTYRNFYNGGGVGLGDINNDGLIDIYLNANQGKNRLYLNKGDFRFEDITDRAGVAGTRAWSTGVAMADVNGDGWLDIYVCNSGDVKGDNKQNELFINNGDLTFTEKGAEYGLDERGFTTHAAFFDYDRDGDLDAYILNNSYEAIGSFNLRKNERPKRDPLGGDKLLRNDDGHFTDVSEAAGIYGSVIGFGLGVTVGDMNRDSWPDIYVCNDFFERDYLYINNHDGTFREELTQSMNSISAASMGADIADINNDGYPDLFVTEMLPNSYDRLKTLTTFEDWNRYQYNLGNDYYHQFTRNTFQLNNGNGTFSEIGRMVGVEATDWSWGALLFDMNNDGLRDIFVSNGIRQDLTNQDFLQYAASEEFVKTAVSKNKVNYKKLVEVIPSEKVPDFAFINKGGIVFEDQTQALGLEEPNFSNGSAYGDLDNDGDLDLVVNNIDSKATVYRNHVMEMNKPHFIKFVLKGEGKNSFATGAQIEIELPHKKLFGEQIPTRGFESSVDPRPNFGLGSDSVINAVTILWPSGKKTFIDHPKADQILTVKESDASSIQTNSVKTDEAVFKMINSPEWLSPHRENEFIDFDRDRLLYQMVSNEGPKLCKGDVNNDGLEDFYVGGAKDEPGMLYVQQPGGNFKKTNQTLFEQDKVSEDCGCTFFDADKDGDADLFVTTGSNEFPTSSTALIDHLYINNGKGEFNKSNQLLPSSQFESTSVVRTADYDSDGDQDLFVGVRMQPFLYGVPTNGYILSNDGKGNFRDVSASAAPMLKGIGMITDALWTDVDGDKDHDLIIVGEWMAIRLLLNNAGNFADVTDKFGLTNSTGWWNKIEPADLDGDGDTDYVVGNLGLNSRFKASAQKPMHMYINDFDQNGSVEQLMCRWWGDKEYPMALRHDLLSQLPELKKKYPDYASYKNQTIEDIFNKEQLKQSLKLEAKELRTVVLFNEGGKFRIEPLPVEAQLSPVYAITVGDFDRDGMNDILLGGNQYRVKPEAGRYDASFGAMFKGLKSGGFEFVPATKSGISIHGEIRDMESIKWNGKNHILVLRNNDTAVILETQ